ncbi:MAG: hypothetical protein HC875_31335 [Anaerolineales bacterium]|nr:hypothetical protein [Anaerolineales bacterium]
MTTTTFDIEFIDETKGQIAEIGNWLNYSPNEVVAHAISKLYWETAPDEVKAQKFYEKRVELRELVQKGLDKIADMETGESSPALEKLSVEQIGVAKQWLINSWANIELLEIFMEADNS